MTLKELLHDVTLIEAEGDIDQSISGVCSDSRRVRKGFLFIALVGETNDGHDYLQDVLNAGAVAVLSEKPKPPGLVVTWIRVADARYALAHVAKCWYGAVDEKLMLVAVTGTNGKTSIVHILQKILNQFHGPTGRIGTIDYSTGSRLQTARLTTPEALDIHALLEEMVGFGCRSAVLEASSVAIDRERVTAIAFDLILFTNLSRDHLDYHGDMENYFAAKSRLFQPTKGYAPVAVINADDTWGQRLLTETDLQTVSYSFHHTADVVGKVTKSDLNGVQMNIQTQDGDYAVKSRLLGRYNAENILAACAASHALGFSQEATASAIARVPCVRGRMERISTNMPFEVIVDYAHTDDALYNLLDAARALTEKRVIVVFGCGGDRDIGKRPLMGKHAATLADIAILTSDNPRSEDPMEIIKQVESGIEELGDRSAEFHRIPDRRTAIGKAIKLAQEGDIVLIAGKGHENYQIIGDNRISFDDRAVALEAVSML